ncbi:protein of unknown function DUF86 [Ferroglobus placidus DSM 10642]|uniref:DUF86 domain-containing protein n=1 Tax=Ferroglobus placidus (strain DSM 10642 / AEDII12DO) TaxID=589924 RepID=D3RZT9_FERPA|nr:DUF86 domain-containing protein [Ferroglobus placidus]ADC66002.1 protein of unknown function DUF86 [Ferroglobus placidus DSM 10642]
MDEKRIARYLDKLNHIEERLNDIKEWIDEALEDKKTRLAVYKAAQEAIEATCDIIAMYLKDNRIPPKDDYTNIEKWGELTKQKDLADCLKIANGLRNRLVHHYNGLNDALAIESIKDIFPCIERFVKEVRGWLRRVT